MRTWSVNWERAHPFDFRIFLVPGDTELGPEIFNRHDDRRKNQGLADKKRATLVQSMLEAVQRPDKTSPSHAREILHLRRYFLWADAGKVALSIDQALATLPDFVKSTTNAHAHTHWVSAMWIIGILASISGTNVRDLRVAVTGATTSEWCIELPNADTPCFDFRSLLTPETAALYHRAYFRQAEAEKNKGLSERGRVEFARELLQSFRTVRRTDTLSDSTLATELSALWQVARLVYQQTGTFTRRTVFAFIDAGHLDKRLPIFRTLARLDLSEAEQQVLKRSRQRQSVYKPRDLKSPWLINITDVGDPHIDVRFLIRPEDLAKGHRAFRKKTESYRQSCVDGGTRALFAEGVLRHLKSDLEAGLSLDGTSTKFRCTAQFLRWCDANDVPVGPYTAVEALSSYSLALSGRVRIGALKANSARQSLYRLVHMIAGIEGVHVAVVLKRLAVPPAEHDSGRQGTYVDSDDVRKFLSWLKAIVDAITIDVIDSDLSAGLTVHNAGQTITIPGPDSSWVGRIPNRFLNITIIRARVEAELLRFIAATATNRNIAIEARIEDLEWARDLKGARIKGFKPRKGGVVTANIPPEYRLPLERHIEFVRTFTESGDPKALLFPSITAGSPSLVRAAQNRKDPLQFDVGPAVRRAGYFLSTLLRPAGVKALTARGLRYSKGDFYYFSTGGDSLKVSRALGNTPSVAWASYGGKGNLPLAQREMTAFFKSWDSKTQIAVAPGGCASPRNPVPFAEFGKVPSCGSENACFHCAHYRGVDSLDYIHLLQTRMRELRLRTVAEPGRASEFMYFLELIQRIVESYSAQHPEQHKDLEMLAENVESGDLHSTLRTSIDVLRRLNDGL